MPRKFTQKESKVQFENLGFNLLSQYNGITSKVRLSCRNKHIFETTYKNIKKNPTCKECKKENTLIDVRSILKENGFELISKNNKFKINLNDHPIWE